MLPAFALAQAFVIEEESLSSLPNLVEAVIRTSMDADASSCRLIGKTINLSVKSTRSAYAVTTANACNWGAAIGPIWLVLVDPRPTLVLSYGGYSLVLGKQSKNGLRNATISSATTGWVSESIWQFDGERYVKVKEEKVDMH